MSHQDEKNNRELAFIQLYDQYISQIYRFILLKTSSVQDAEDIASEVFFKFWKNISVTDANVKDIENPRALLYCIANNLITDFYRKKNKKELTIIDSDKNISEILSENIDLYKKAELESDIKQTIKSISKLRNDYQNVIIWHYLEELSIKEVAQIMDKSQGAVRVLLHRALNVLKQDLKNESKM